MSMRDKVESTIKALKLDRSRIIEVSKIKYVDIIQRIEHTFVLDYGDIHWSNMGNGFQQHLSCMWILLLEKRNQNGYNQKKATWAK